MTCVPNLRPSVALYMCRYYLSLKKKIRHHIIPPLAFWHKSFNYPLRRLVHINKTLEKENSSAWYCKFRKRTSFLVWLVIPSMTSWAGTETKGLDANGSFLRLTWPDVILPECG